MTSSKLEHTFLNVALLCTGYFLLTACGITQNTIENPPQKKPETVVSVDDSTLLEEMTAVKPFTADDVPETTREFRGVWVATVDNIDWPSAPGLPVSLQKVELKAIMEQAVRLHLNAVIFQIRPSADAFYDSPFEPWSYYLTGRQGEAPEPYYDPLKFAIEQAHKRGLELHVWFNPFRAYHPAAEPAFAPGFIKNTHPKWVVKYGDYYWLNPGNKKVRQYAIRVIMDVVKRYDIDGVHLDDYFYPYPRFDANGNPIPFPDEVSYSSYSRANPPVTKGDWRRQNVNIFVKKLGKSIHQADSALLFGISPFGIWRPGHPPQIVGLDAYGLLFADSRKWLRLGWVDYLAPQLYWAIDNEGQQFPLLLRWWNEQNVKNKFVWPGLYTSNVANYPEYGFPSTEIINQIDLIRDTEGVPGHIHFSMQALMQNYGGISDALRSGPYQKMALVPRTSWKSVKQPIIPHATLTSVEDHYMIQLSSSSSSKPWLWVIKTKYGNNWKITIYPGSKEKIELPTATKRGKLIGVVVSLVNDQSMESELVLLFPNLLVTG